MEYFTWIVSEVLAESEGQVLSDVSDNGHIRIALSERPFMPYIYISDI